MSRITTRASAPTSITAPPIGFVSVFVTDVFGLAIKLPDGTVINIGGNGGGGATTFASLTDTPNNFTGLAGQALVVNALETGLEAAPIPITSLQASIDKTIADNGGNYLYAQSMSWYIEDDGADMYINGLGATNGIFLGSGSTVVGIRPTEVLFDTPTSVLYANDVSANYTLRSLVDMGWVLSQKTPVISKIINSTFDQLWTKTMTIYGSNFTPTTSVSVTDQTITSVVYISPTELSVIVTSGDIDGEYSVTVYNGHLTATVDGAFKVDGQKWVDLSTNGDPLIIGQGATDDIRHDADVTIVRSLIGLEITGLGVNTGWVKMHKYGWKRGENKTFEMVFRTHNNGNYAQVGIGSVQSDEANQSQWNGFGEVMVQFNSGVFANIISNNGTPGTIAVGSMGSKVSGGFQFFKMRVETDGNEGSKVTVYRLSSGAQKDWVDDSNVIYSKVMVTSMLPNQPDLLPFMTPVDDTIVAVAVRTFGTTDYHPQQPAQIDLTYNVETNIAGAVSIDIASKKVRNSMLNLTANVATLTLINPTNGSTGQILVNQDAVGGRTVAIPVGGVAKVKTSQTSGANFLISTAPNASSLISWIYDGGVFYFETSDTETYTLIP